MKFDLHMHSDYSSDGELLPAELIERAKQAGLKVVALSDHDSIEGVEKMMAEAKKEGIICIPACECSTQYGDYSVHCLAYGIDLKDSWFLERPEISARDNEAVFEKRVRKLEDKYSIHVDLNEIMEKAAGKNPWFPLIETVLKDPQIQNHPDFQDYLPGGKRSDPAPVNFFWDRCQPGSDLYVPAIYPDLKETIKKIHEAGGLAIIAHPFKTFYEQPERLEEVIGYGIDGLEAYSNYHTPEMNAYYEKVARENNLLITCGSDFHGRHKPSIEMGDYGLEEGEKSDEILHTFLNALHKDFKEDC